MKLLNNDTLRALRLTTLAIAMALSLAACGKSGADGAKQEQAEKEEGHSEGQELTLTTEEAERAGVKVEAINAQKTSASIVVTASIQPDQDRIARVAPRTEGRIVSAPAKLGDRVRAGQALATLDSVGVGEAHAALVLAQSELRIADADFKRAEALVADEIIPRKDYLRAQAERDKATASVRAATDRLRLLGGNPNAGSQGVSGFAVTAPFAGTVIEKKATLGDLAGPSEALFTVADLSRVWILADLPESALAKVNIGSNAKISVPSYPSEVFTGRVSHIGAVLNKETRTVAARIEVPNADGRLKPEMFATATIDVGGDQRDLMTLPDAAIVLMQGQPTVFVFEQGAYEMRVIEPGERIGGRTVVKAGIKGGEQVVTAGAYELKARKQKSQLGHGH
jgi:membrane fusion protein, heavy metal efflux system